MARTLRLKIFPKGSNPRKHGGPKPITINVSGGSLKHAKTRLAAFLKHHMKNIEVLTPEARAEIAKHYAYRVELARQRGRPLTVIEKRKLRRRLRDDFKGTFGR